MTKKNDITSINQTHMQRRYNIAYTINNYQPVLCTYINEQPLFYMDYVPEDEEEALELFGDEFLLTDDMSDKSSYVDMLDETGMLEFLADTADALHPSGQKVEKTMDTLLDRISESRYAASLITHAKDYKTKFVYDGSVSLGEYDKTANKVRISPNLDPISEIIALSSQLRSVWQHRSGAMIDPLNFYPDHAVLANRAQKTDIAVCMVRIAWELMLAGNKSVWAFIEGSSMADLGRSFAREAQLDFRNLNNGMASAAVFETWFLSDRCQDADKILIQQMLNDYTGCLFNDEQTSAGILKDLVIALGTQPFGKNYLSPYINTITQDALFTELRDRSNANFLWFIKFEHSFKQLENESEHALQGDEDNLGHGTHHGHSIKNKNKLGDERYNNEEGQLITLPVQRKRAATAGQKTFRSHQSDTADVIAIDAWRHNGSRSEKQE